MPPTNPDQRSSVQRRAVDPVARMPVLDRLKVNEIFYSLQGESTRAGRPCVLVRLTGCQMRCTWCDSAYSFHEGTWMTSDAVLAAVATHGCPLVELTGGEPLLQPAARPLLVALCDAGYEVMLETGGGVDVGDVDPRVRRILDIKCPASGESENNRWSNLELLGPRDEVKLVLADEADYRWACARLEEGDWAGRVAAVHFAPVHGSLDPVALADWILRDRLPVRLQLQIHKLLWGAETRGV